MSSLSVRLPLTRNTADGFTMIKDLKTLVNQNLKMLILTAPGERVMEPLFGVGLRNYLFQNFDGDTLSNISTQIRKQVKTYMPMVTVISINYDSTDMNVNTLGIRLEYAVQNIGITDLLEFTI